MSISSSVIYDDKTQADGTRQIIEKHTDHVGVVYTVFLSNKSQEYEAVDEMNARVPSIEASLADNEDSTAMTRVEDGENPLTIANNPIHSTSKRLAITMVYAMMRARSSKTNLVRIIILLAPLLVYLNNNFTDNQLTSYLNITQTQLTKMRTRISTILNAPTTATSVQDLVDECDTYYEEFE